MLFRSGPEVVLEGDLLNPTALDWLSKVTPGMKPEQVRELRRQICRQVLPQHVDSLIVYVDACRTIPEDRLPEIRKKVNEAFDAQQLPMMVRQAGFETVAEYESQLRSRGQSLDRVRKMFFERALAQQWVQQKVKTDAEIPHADMIAWYQNHLADYDFPAKATFEQMTVKYGAGRPRDEAWNMLAAMGNDVLEGQAFADVAKERSEGPAAKNGGRFDWTTKGSLVSKVVDSGGHPLTILHPLTRSFASGQFVAIHLCAERHGLEQCLPYDVLLQSAVASHRRCGRAGDKRDGDLHLFVTIGATASSNVRHCPSS